MSVRSCRTDRSLFVQELNQLIVLFFQQKIQYRSGIEHFLCNKNRGRIFSRIHVCKKKELLLTRHKKVSCILQTITDYLIRISNGMCTFFFFVRIDDKFDLISEEFL